MPFGAPSVVKYLRCEIRVIVPESIQNVANVDDGNLESELGARLLAKFAYTILLSDGESEGTVPKRA